MAYILKTTQHHQAVLMMYKVLMQVQFDNCVWKLICWYRLISVLAIVIMTQKLYLLLKAVGLKNASHTVCLLFCLLKQCESAYQSKPRANLQLNIVYFWLRDPELTNVLLVHSYRKIPGDKCEGGEMPERKEIDLSKRCVSDLLGPELLVSTFAY